VRKEFKNLYDHIEQHDSMPNGACGSIQWKGTDVCMDIHCVCGAQAHFDGDFLYYYECAHCGRLFAVGRWVRFVELSGEHADEARTLYPKTAEVWRVADPTEGVEDE